MSPTSTETDGTVPRVSIVVPAYNRERYLALLLDSVQAQTFPGWELVVFDDGSTDATAQVAGSYAARDARITVAGGVNGGVAAARNRGLSFTDRRTEFVIFLDSDDVWAPDALETLVDVLDRHGEYSSAHALARCIDGDGRDVPGDDLAESSRRRIGFHDGHLVSVPLDQPTTFGDLAYHNWVWTPGTHLIRRQVVEQVGGFDVDTDPADDWDFAIRVARHSPIGFVDRPLLLWRRHPMTLTNTAPRWRSAYFTVRANMLSDPANTPEQTAVARQAYLLGVVGTCRQARERFSARQLRPALREVAKALQELLLYLRVDVPLRLGHYWHGARRHAYRRAA
ncbi:MAG TPA: glycosyltransferase [Acidimicrobiales bacterium]